MNGWKTEHSFCILEMIHCLIIEEEDCVKNNADTVIFHTAICTEISKICF